MRTTDDNLFKLFDVLQHHLYELLYSENLSDFDYYTFVVLENLDNIIRKKEKLVKQKQKTERWKNEGI